MLPDPEKTAPDGVSVRVRGALPFDVFGVVTNALSHAYPNLLLGPTTGDECLHAIVPHTDRPGMPADPDAVIPEVLSLGPGGFQYGAPQKYLAMVANWIEAQYQEHGEPENYLEQRMTTSSGARFVLTMRRLTGKTPWELQKAAEAERDAAVAEVARLRAALEAAQPDAGAGA